jgi:hypothetical protein
MEAAPLSPHKKQSKNRGKKMCKLGRCFQTDYASLLFEITKFWFCDRRHFLIVESRAWRWKKNTKTGRSCERSRSVKKRIRKKCWKAKGRSEVGKNEGKGLSKIKEKENN